MNMNNIINEHKEEQLNLLQKEFIPREGLEKARESLKKSDLIHVIIGPRRAGKSVFGIEMLKGQDFGYVNFDDERLLEQTDFDAILKAIVQVYGNVKTLFFDEIQNVPKWEVLVNRLQRQGHKLVLTGSNAHLLSQELSTHLTGRYIAHYVFPFSFKEYLLSQSIQYKGILSVSQEALIMSKLTEFLGSGGYPEVILGRTPDGYLKTLFESILLKDIVRRFNVRYSGKLSELGYYLMSNPAREYSLRSLQKAINFQSPMTVEKYLNYLTATYLVFSVPRFSFKAKERSRSPRKAYPVDLGMLTATKFASSPDTGRIMETLIMQMMLHKGITPYSYKTEGGKEVDLVIHTGGRPEQLIQVCLDMNDAKTAKRELSALLKASEELSCDNLMILTWDTERTETIDGKKIQITSLWKWLLA